MRARSFSRARDCKPSATKVSPWCSIPMEPGWSLALIPRLLNSQTAALECPRPRRSRASGLLFLRANAVKQPPGAPMILATPQAEIVVLGTKFKLSGGTEVTYIETDEGAVQLTRKIDGESIEVGAGHWAAVSNRNGPLMSQTSP